MQEHNTRLPHSEFRGQTPDEMYLGTGGTLDFSQHKVKLQGRNLETLFRLICQHRASEVREADLSQSFEVMAEDVPVVERIEIIVS